MEIISCRKYADTSVSSRNHVSYNSPDVKLCLINLLLILVLFPFNNSISVRQNFAFLSDYTQYH